MRRPVSQINYMVMLILAGEGVFFLPFVIPRIFRPTLLESLGYTNTELGSAFSAYGVVAAISYFFGGPLADRFSPRILIASALMLTALGGFYLSSGPGFIGLILLYAYWGFTSIFLLWAALIKAARYWGGDTAQGSAFGWLEGGRGLTAALIGALAVMVFSPVENGSAAAFTSVLIVVSLVVLVLGLGAFVILPSADGQVTASVKTLDWPGIRSLATLPAVRLQALIIFCAYIGYKATDDLSLMAAEVMGYSDEEAAQVGASALWLRPIFPLLAGLFADYIRSVFTTMLVLFAIMLLGSGWLAFSALGDGVQWLWFFVPVFIALMGVYGLRGVYFAGMEEAQIPLRFTGTAVGLMSVVGYLPDVFFSPLMGWVLDAFPKDRSHSYVFFMVALASGVGCYAVWRLRKSVIDQ